MLDKLMDLFRGENKEVHETKSKYTAEMTKIRIQAKAQVVSSEKMVKMIESSTAFKIAKATGRLK